MIDLSEIKKKLYVIDARSKGRFEGKEPEPRKELRSGSIPNSACLPFKELINEDHSFKNKDQISLKFNIFDEPIFLKRLIPKIISVKSVSHFFLVLSFVLYLLLPVRYVFAMIFYNCH